MLKKISILLLLYALFASSCRERVDATSVSRKVEADYDYDTVTFKVETRIDTNEMTLHSPRIISIGDSNRLSSLAEYQYQYDGPVDSANVAKSLASKIKILADDQKVVELERYGARNAGTDSAYIEEHIFERMPVYLYNVSDQMLDLHMHRDRIGLATEAKDKDGVWKPIEFMLFYESAYQKGDFLQGDYRGERIFLLPNHVINCAVPRFTGDYSTELRLRLVQRGDTIYSNTFKGSINLDQFVIPEDLKKDSKVSSFKVLY